MTPFWHIARIQGDNERVFDYNMKLLSFLTFPHDLNVAEKKLFEKTNKDYYIFKIHFCTYFFEIN